MTWLWIALVVGLLAAGVVLVDFGDAKGRLDNLLASPQERRHRKARNARIDTLVRMNLEDQDRSKP